MMVLASSVVVLSCFIIALIYFFVRTEQNRELQSSVERIEKLLKEERNIRRAHSDSSNERRRNRPRPVSPMDFSRIPYYVTYVVTSAESDFGEVIFTNDSFLPILPETFSKAKTYVAKDFFIDGDLSVLYVSQKTEDGQYMIQVSLDLERDISSHLMDKIPAAIACSSLPIILVSFLMSLLITKNTMAPVIRLTKAANKISASNLGTLLPRTNNGDEIDTLASTFNSLFERLKNDFDREKNFTSDVSHELKTPVAVILGQTNLLLRWGKDDPNQLAKSLESIKNEAKSMDAVITNLLQISRLENGKIKPSYADVDIKQMFLRLVEEFLAVSPEVDFRLPEKESVVFRTDPELLHQVLTVVISNSVKFCGGQCSIRLDWEKTGGQIKINLEDNGEGFSEKILPHVFQRFYRGDEAHVRSVGGAGLGLSIARTIVESLEGTIRAYNANPKGAGIEIAFKI